MNRLMEFLREVWAEIGKITWPTRQELWESTWVVIASVIVLTVFIGAVDQVFNYLLRQFVKLL